MEGAWHFISFAVLHVYLKGWKIMSSLLEITNLVKSSLAIEILMTFSGYKNKIYLCIEIIFESVFRIASNFSDASVWNLLDFVWAAAAFSGRPSCARVVYFILQHNTIVRCWPSIILQFHIYTIITILFHQQIELTF